MAPQQSEVPEGIQILQKLHCRCGNIKSANVSFCRECYISLPESLKKAVRARAKNAVYILAYQQACEHLDGVRLTVDLDHGQNRPDCE